ncbi:sensor histidine kinase [Altererythrobacter sp.]|uniref:sensor histidine kinase n=1 Tax=Altererythrobacter sp. TaxID=1872480 RepID=UPI003D02E9DB
MASQDSILAARGLTDAQDHLLSADQPLAELQERCGGEIPGLIAIPELLELVRQGRQMGLRMAREFSAFDGQGNVTAFVRINPLSGEEDGAVCELLIDNWQRESASGMDEREALARIDAIDRSTAELVARLDSSQHVKAVESAAEDLQLLFRKIRSDPGKIWTDYVELIGIEHRQPLHWRLLDGAHCRIAGSERNWTVRLLPTGSDTSGNPPGFELLFVADRPLPISSGQEDDADDATHARLIGEALTPALRQPIKRIIANAETIRARLAGPLRKEYSEYAGDIASAGEHLSALLDDLADLEVVEADDFSVAKERIDLGDAARRAAGILGVKAQDKSITLNLPESGGGTVAIGEFRRVLQILLNLIGNAINYSPSGSEVSIELVHGGKDEAGLVIRDQGPGMTAEQQERVFAKFERLGRAGDGGSGLGLYISRRLAEAMRGTLTLESEPDKGASFTLTLPAA